MAHRLPSVLPRFILVVPYLLDIEYGLGVLIRKMRKQQKATVGSEIFFASGVDGYFCLRGVEDSRVSNKGGLRWALGVSSGLPSEVGMEREAQLQTRIFSRSFLVFEVSSGWLKWFSSRPGTLTFVRHFLILDVLCISISLCQRMIILFVISFLS